MLPNAIIFYMVLSVFNLGEMDGKSTGKQGNKMRIIGGSPIETKEVPYFAQIHGTKPKNSTETFFCGGSIIHERLVLTAAHCTNRLEKPYLILVGSKEFNKGFSYSGKRVIKKEGDIFYNNFAIIVIDARFHLIEDKVAIIRLVDDNFKFQMGDEAMVTGFGANKIGKGPESTLLSTNLRLIPLEECRKTYNFSQPISDDHLCANFPMGTQAVCHGDDGGPLVKDYRLIGIVTDIYKCGTLYRASLFVNILHIKKWIIEEIRSNDWSV